jgi:acylphosphatase
VSETARHVVIHGRVQDVWFRGWMRQEAQSLGLRGWVRNRRDGTVEAVLQGEPGLLDQMLERCRQGPPAAKVLDITVKPVPVADFQDFSQLPTE